MSGIINVTMGVTEREVENVKKLGQRFHVNNAEAVGIALDLTAKISDLLKDGGDLLVRQYNGSFKKITIPGILS